MTRRSLSRLRRKELRLLLVLLTDAENLSSLVLSEVARLSPGRAPLILLCLRNAGLVTAEWENRSDDGPRRRYYRLTPEGRAYAHAALGLTPRAEAPRR